MPRLPPCPRHRTRYPELRRLALRTRAWAIRSNLPVWLPGVILAFLHWCVFPPLLAYNLLVPESPAPVAAALACCTLVGTTQAVYDSKCPLITVERHLLDCPTWWRGLPFNLVAKYIQPVIVIGGTCVGLVRFIANTLLEADE